MAVEQDELLWRAMSNPVRRTVLDLLRDGPRTTGDLAHQVGDLSRYAVMQHLGILQQAGLVLVRREGRQRFNYLNAVPLHQVYERWVSGFARAPAARATALKRFVEQGEHMEATTQSKPVRAVRIEAEIKIAAPRARVFEALTTKQAEWYPHNYGGARLKQIVFEERVGGLMYEDWGDGRGILYGTVTYFDPPGGVATRGHLQGGVSLETVMTLVADGEATVLKHRMIAFGEISDDDELGIRAHGDLSKYAPELKDWCERAS